MCQALLVAVLVALAAAPTARAQVQQRDLDVANCVFDSVLAASFLAKGVFQVMQAIVECPTTQAGCTSEISKAVMSWTATGSFISAAANECGVIANTNAACAADIIGLISSLAGVSGASSSLVNTCVVIDNGGRRLYSQQPQILGKCIMNTFISTNLLGKASLQLTAATRDCPNQGAASNSGRARCSADVSNLIASFGTVAAFLSKAASQCADTASIEGLCSGDASGLIASLAQLAGTASGMVNSCPQPTRRLQAELEEHLRNSTSPIFA